MFCGQHPRLGRKVELMASTRALFFDFDGLIVETEWPDFCSWMEIYNEFGQQLPLDEWLTTIGIYSPEQDPCRKLERLLGEPIDRESIRARRRLRYRELVNVNPVLPGVEALLRDACRLGIHTAVVSSSPRPWVEEQLRERGLLPWFHGLHTGDSGPSKPDPALYLAALQAAGTAADEAIALEDSENGIAAARAAGIFCVAVPTAMTRQLCLDRANIQVDSLAAISLEELIQARAEGALQARARPIEPGANLGGVIWSKYLSMCSQSGGRTSGES
jgi:HAD superfamily hydrolase (TIGR01509 family)